MDGVSGAGCLIDTCIWIDLERGRIGPADVARITKEEEVFLSPITIAELQYGVELATDSAIRQARQRSVDLLKKKPILRIDEDTGAIYGRLAAELHKIGKRSDYRVMDLWMAAQALQFNLCILTYNAKDFQDVAGLAIVSLMPS